MPSHRLFPVEMADLPDGRDGTTQHWRCESSATWLQAWDSATRDGCWASAELPDLNVSNIWESPDEWHEDWAEAQGSWIEAKQHLHMRVSPRHPRPWPTTLVVSDGSVWHSGTEQATGTFGWVVRPRTGIGWGNFEVEAAGMGTVEGHWSTLHSTRAEARGLLSGMRAMRRALALPTNHPAAISHMLDNEAVVKQYGSVQHWGPLKWLSVSDKDIWRAILEEKHWWSTTLHSYDVCWIPSHPEDRAAQKHWTEEDVLNHLADRWAEKAQVQLRNEDTEAPPMTLHPPTTSHLHWSMSLTAPGDAARHTVTGNTKTALQNHLTFCYLHKYAASHPQQCGSLAALDTTLRTLRWVYLAWAYGVDLHAGGGGFGHGESPAM